jgi:signal transduction histidine kinase/ABC-type multidrug transport system ATPase subunit
MAVAERQSEHELTDPLLRIRGLTVSFGSVGALNDVGLEVRPGELVAIAGEPGAGKTTLVRCLAGDIAPGAGEILLGERPLPSDTTAVGRRGVSVVWQDLELCDNLDVAGNVMLGRETSRLLFSGSRVHTAAAAVLEGLRIPLRDTTQLVGSLPAGQRQLVAIAKALSAQPRLLVLDEPTSALGLAETGQVEELIGTLRSQGLTIVLASRDVEQLFRLADRIIVLHHGRVVGDLDPEATHPDDVTALLSGQEIDSSARRQLTRLHGLADSLVSADPSSSLSLIMSALGAALGAEQVCIHQVSGRALTCAASLGFTTDQVARFRHLPLGASGGPPGISAESGERVIETDLRGANPWMPYGDFAASAGLAASWSLPVMGRAGVSAVITVFRPESRGPERDELDLLTLYSGYAASAVERERLLEQVTARNRVLETIREMLETLAGPVPVAQGLAIALDSLRRGLRADEVGLFTRGEAESEIRGYAGPDGSDPAGMSVALRAASERGLAETRRDGTARRISSGLGLRTVGVPFNAPAGPSVLLAAWTQPQLSDEENALIEDASHSLRLALEREEAGLSHQKAAALHRSRELQRGFLSRLSHELRTPLTAIRGYASSLMQPDVTWDGDSQQRFLDRIAAESARLGRLVDDLLDFSAIESGVMRMQLDWCDLRLVVEAAVSCLPAETAERVTVACAHDLPVVWADHDRLEQVFVNLLTNAFRHNPPGTRVTVAAATPTGASPAARGEVEITVSDNGSGFPAGLAGNPFDSARRVRSASAGAGVGLSITRGIVTAHGGDITLTPSAIGTTFRVALPIERSDPEPAREAPADGAAAGVGSGQPRAGGHA